MRTIARSSSKRKSASVRASSVLPTPVGPRKRNDPIGRCGIRQTGSRSPDGAGHRGDRFVLADHPLVQDILHADELRHLALHEPRHGHAGPLGDDLGDVLRVDLLLEQPDAALALEVIEGGAGLLDLALELGDAPVADLGRLLEVGLALEIGAKALELLLEELDATDRLLLVRPAGEHRVALLGEVGELGVERLETVLARGVGLLGQRDPLDLQLSDAALHDVDLRGQRVDLDAQLRGGFVDEVDRLVGQEAPGEVAVGQHGGRDQSGVLDAHAVVHLVALLETPEDGDRVVDARLAHEHLLEPAFERGVLLDVLAVLVQGGGADHPQHAACEQRLEHVAGVHRAFGGARADDGVQLVDEGDHLALGVGDLLEHRLEPLLELTPVLGAGDHRTEVEADEPLVLQALGHVALDDAARQPFHDGGLAHAGLADEHRVVLGAARQHLDHPADLLVAPDDGIDLPGPRRLGEVAAVPLEGLVLLLRVLRRDPVAASDLLHRGEHLLTGDPEAVGQRQQEVLRGQVLVGEVGALPVRRVDHLLELSADARLPAVGLGQLADGVVGRVPHRERCETERAG